MKISEKNLILKRTLAIFLSVIMLFMQMPMGVLAIGAGEQEVEQAASGLQLGSSVTVESKTTYAFTPEKSGMYRIYSSKNGDTDPYVYLYDENKNLIAADDDSGGNLNFDLNYDMIAGATYYIEADSYREEISYVLTVEESEYLGIEIVSIPTFEVVENDVENGYWEARYQDEIVDRYFVYYAEAVLDEAVVMLNYKDGHSEQLAFTDENGFRTGLSVEWDFYKNPWKIGNDNCYYITYKGMKAIANATVVESPVESIEVVSIGSTEFIEHDESRGYWTKYYFDIELDEKYFEYAVEDVARSVKLAVKYKDGSTEEVVYYDEETDEYSGISFYSDQYKNPWTLGENEFEIWYKGFCITEKATVVETPVQSIRVVSGDDFEYTEFDESCGYWIDTRDFHYDIWHLAENLVIEVTYKNGDVETLPYYNEEGEYNGISYTDTQYETPWKVGSDNELIISYKGVSTTINVTVKPGIVESILIGDITVTEGTGGYVRIEEMPDGTKDYWYYYEIYAEDVTVNLTDGTTVRGNQWEVCDQLGMNIIMHPENYQMHANPWGVGEYNITASLGGKETEFLFTIVESDIESISVENIEIEQNKDGYWESGYWNNMGEWVEENWFVYDLHSQIEMTITYKDGTSYTGTGSQFDYDILIDQSYDNQWQAGETYTAKIFMLGKFADFLVTLTESSIKSIEVIDTQNFKYYENDTEHGELTPDGFIYSAWSLASRVTIRVTYKDGSTQEIPYYNEYGNPNGIGFFDNQRNQLWTVGSDNPLTIIYGGVRTTINAIVEPSPIESIVVEPITHIQYTGGNWNYGADGEYYYYDVSPQNITITYLDGTVISGHPYEIEQQTGIYPSFRSEQSGNGEWGIGDHTATIIFMGKEAEYTVSIVESNVASITVSSKTCIEGTNGWWQEYSDENGDSGYYYFYEVYPSEIVVTFKDGTSVAGTRDEIYEQTGYYPSLQHNQGYIDQWGVGTHTVTVNFMGASCEFDVIIEPSPVESIEAESVSVFQYTNGHWEFYDAEQYYYYNVYPENVTVTYKDGRVITGHPHEIYMQTGYNFSFFDNQSYYNQWDIGTNTANASFMGATCEYDVIIEVSPIESVEVETVTRTEYTNGTWSAEGFIDENDNWVETGRYFFYYAAPEKITITYTDGSVIEGDTDEIYKQTGMRAEFGTDQSIDNPWGIGDHTAQLYFMGETIEYTVSIVESNIASITVPKKTIVEGTNGNWCEQRLNDGTYAFYYNYDFDIDEMTITYKDGSSITGTRHEIYEQTGFMCEYNTENDYYSRWEVGTHTVPFTFMGKEYGAEVEITPSPVEKIEVDPITIIQNTNGYWDNQGYYDEDENWVDVKFYNYNPVPKNIKVTYTDGTVLETSPGDLGGQTGYYISTLSGQDAFNQWDLGTHITLVGYMGKIAAFEVTIEQSPVESIVVEPLVMDEGMNEAWVGNEIDGYRPWYNYRPKNITVNLSDGSQLVGSYDELREELNGEISYEAIYNNSETGYRPVGNYKGTVTVLGVSAEYDIIIEECKIESVTVLPTVLVENQDGWTQSGYNHPDTGEWIEADWYKYHISPDMILVRFKDGTSYFGDMRDLQEIGYNPIVNSDQSYFNQWQAGKHNASLQFYNFEVPFDVEVVEEKYGEDNAYSYGVMSDGTAVLYSYNGSYDMVIPETIDGYTITGIGKECLYGSSITSLSLPSTIRFIDRYAFYSCNYLETIRIYDTLEGVANNAFLYCDGIANVVVNGSKENANIYIASGNDYLSNANWSYTADCTEHEYSDVCDADCNICHAIREPEHAFEWIIDNEAGCEEDGLKHEECNLCGEVRNLGTIIAAKGEHENTYLVKEVPATCGNEGYTGDLWCSDCGNLVTPGSSIPKTEHQNTELVGEVEATCGQMGYTGDLYCKDCKTVITWGEEIAATECYKNTEIQGAYDATCGKEGYTGDLVCLDCGNVIEKGEIIPATGEHKNTYRKDANDATCCYDGYTGYLVCSDCESIIAYGESIPATGEHKSTYRKGAKPATCGQNGRTGELICEESGRVLERSQTIPATGNHGELTIANAYNPTCTDTGYTGDIVCEVCKNIMQYGEEIPATGKHIYDNAYDTNCNTCGEYREVALAPATLSLIGGVVNQGDTIRVDVRIDGNTGFAGLQFGVIYDKAYLTLKDVESQMDDFFVTVGNSIVFDSYKNHTADGVIATLVFEVDENAPVGDYNIQLRFMSGSTEDFEAVLMTNAITTITVESAVAGDANGDGTLNITDVIMIRRYLASMDPTTMTSEIAVKKGADANNDGVVDAIDLAYVRKALADMSAI